METTLYTQVRNWLYRNARHLELSLWQYHFEGGSAEAVVDALMFYQNADGGFGHALEADNWNPASTPVTTNHALLTLREIQFDDLSHPIYQGILNYLNAEKDLLPYGWRFTVPSNDGHPHAPWWNYSEVQNKLEYVGVTAELSAFILQYADAQSPLVPKALKFADALLSLLRAGGHLGDMGLQGLILLADTVQKLGLTAHDPEAVHAALGASITKAIEHDTEKWAFYGVRPSNYIHGPDSPFYAANAEIVEKELEYLLKTKPKDDVWGITWTWFDNMPQYEAAFRLSENWWKGARAISNMLLLRNFAKA